MTTYRRAIPFALAAALGLGSMALARAETIDFEGPALGTILSDVFGDGGSGPIGVSGILPGCPDNAAVIFDSSNPTGDDIDLGSPNETCPGGGPGIGEAGEVGEPNENCTALGNILIVHKRCEDLATSPVADPDDGDALGAGLNFDFSALGGVTLESMFFIDIEGEEDGGTLELFDCNNNTLALLNLPTVGDNGVHIFDLGPTSGVCAMDVILNGSGAIDNIVFTPEATPEAALGDRVWEDRNANGIQDCQDSNGNGVLGDVVPGQENDPNVSDQGAECGAGIAAVTVNLLDPGAGDCATGDESLIASTMTDSQGFYAFTGLNQNQPYCVEFEQSSVNDVLQCTDLPGFLGLAASPKNVSGSQQADDSDADPDTGRTDNILLDIGEVDRSWDAGFYCLAKLGDTLLHDLDRDGLQDEGEPGVPDRTVQLLVCENNVPGAVIGTTTTDDAGMYMFGELAPGEYAVRFEAPAGFVFSPQNAPGSTAANGCDADPMTGITGCVTLAPNENNPDVDACVNQSPLSAGLGDRVWEDRNANGIQDPDEPGIADVPVKLLMPGPDQVCDTGDETEIAAVLSDGDGLYQFTGLTGGRYCVGFDNSAVSCAFGASQFSDANQGDDDASDSDVNPLSGQTGDIDLLPGAFDPTNDAGIYCPAKLGDQVWSDLNNDGIQDGVPDTEPGVANTLVKLLDCSANPVEDLDGLSSALTDEGGMYMFRVRPGEYRVEFETTLADRVLTTQNAGDDDTLDSDADPQTGRTVCITVASDTYDDSWDAGLVPVIAIPTVSVWGLLLLGLWLAVLASLRLRRALGQGHS